MYTWQKSYTDAIKACNSESPDREKAMMFDYAEKGFCALDIWCLATSVATFVIPRLKEFRSIVDENPQNYSASVVDFDSMIYSFEKIVDDEHLYVSDEERLKIQKGLDLFSKHLIGMWC